MKLLDVTLRAGDNLQIFRYNGFEEMADDIKGKPNKSIYMGACLVDYANFIEEFHIPISLDDFISKYWNIIPYFAAEKLMRGTKVYDISDDFTEYVVECVRYDDMENMDIIELANNDTELFSFPGTLYYYPQSYKKERVVDKQWQTQVRLITKTKQPQS